MNIFDPRQNTFEITDCKGARVVLTPEEIYDQIVDDEIYENGNWFACEEEIVRVCDSSSFPNEYANKIKRKLFGKGAIS